MSGEKGSTYANALLALIFNATTMTGIAQNAVSSPLTSFYLALHTADPTAGGSQTSSEVAYTSYTREAVLRTSAGFTVSGNAVTLTAAVNFPACTGGTATATYFSIGTASSGAGEVLYAGPITPTIAVSTGVTPQLTAGTSVIES